MSKYVEIIELDLIGRSRADIAAATGVTAPYVRSVLSRHRRGLLSLPRMPHVTPVILCGELVDAHVSRPDLRMSDIPALMPEHFRAPSPPVPPAPGPLSWLRDVARFWGFVR